MCNPVHPLYGDLHEPHVPVHVTLCAVITHRHRYTCAPPRCRTSQYLITFILQTVSLWNDIGDSAFDGEGLAGFKSRANAFLLAWVLSPFLVSYCFPFIFFHSMGWYCGAGVFGLIGC